MKIAMTTYREERGSCLIEAGALDLQYGAHWKPWLRLTRRAGGVSASHTFDGLKPVFGTEQAALHYAAELGKSLADEKSALGPASIGRSGRWLSQGQGAWCTEFLNISEHMFRHPAAALPVLPVALQCASRWSG